MKLALIIDIHANFEALNTLSGTLMQADKVLCLGDLVGYYCQVNEVIDYIRALDALCILGNHDYFLLHECPHNVSPAVRFGIEYAASVISASNRQWLETLPLTWGGFLGNVSILLTHGSPWRPLNDYLYADSPLLEQLGQFNYDIVAFGQTHRAFQRFHQGSYLLNPGSVGQSRDRQSRACAMVVDTSTMAIEIIESTFDGNYVINLALMNGAQKWITKHLKDA